MPAVTNDGINFNIAPNTTLRSIGLDERLLPHYLVRELNKVYSALGSCEEYNSRTWHTVEYAMPGWIGRTYREFIEFCYESCENNEEFLRALQFHNWDHEIVSVVGERHVYKRSTS